MLKSEATGSSVMTLVFYLTARRYISEDISSSSLLVLYSPFRYLLHLVHTCASKYLQAISKRVFLLKGEEIFVSVQFGTK
jgi:hypothetical protein